mmetsp:Transcript_18534/g.60380  ORF Transcript_18534/g.60380 Transcript_18534/m.60380 type:complete len:214 (+) Transcript_18534:892-1533(+)
MRAAIPLARQRGRRLSTAPVFGSSVATSATTVAGSCAAWTCTTTCAPCRSGMRAPSSITTRASKGLSLTTAATSRCAAAASHSTEPGASCHGSIPPASPTSTASPATPTDPSLPPRLTALTVARALAGSTITSIPARTAPLSSLPPTASGPSPGTPLNTSVTGSRSGAATERLGGSKRSMHPSKLGPEYHSVSAGAAAALTRFSPLKPLSGSH